MPKKEKKLIEDEKIFHKDVGKGVVKEKDIFASYHHKCKKCGYEKAELINLGAQYSDENELVIARCGKCGYTERLEKKAG